MISSLILGISVTAAASWISWGLVLWYFDPATTGLLGILLFFLTFTLALLSGLTLLLYWLKVRHKKERELRQLLAAARLAGLITLALCGLLVLALFHLLAWWHCVAAILVVFLVEIYLKVRVE